MKGRASFAAVLLEHGADKYAEDDEGTTPADLLDADDAEGDP